MHRPRLALGFLLAPIIFTLAFSTIACGPSGPEKTTIDKFFRASKLGDNTTLANISMVAFDRTTDGTIQGYSIVSVGEEQVKPLQIKELARIHDEAKKADDDFTKAKMAYQDQHADELKALLDAEKKGLPVKGKAAEFKASWDKWREDTKVSSKKVSEAREKLTAERSIADVSVMDPQNPVDVTQFDGELASKDYTISATVTSPSGEKVTKTFVLTMHQARLKGEKNIDGKWIITKMKDETAAGKTS